MTVFLNGKFLPLSEAHISPLDRGFLFGDGVYEVIPVYAGKLFRGNQHLDRLQNSLNGIRLTNPHSKQEWTGILEELIARQPHDNLSIYLQVTRGADNKRDHSFPGNDIQPTVFIMANELKTAPVATTQDGVCAITQPDDRWEHCDIKAITLLANILLRQQATDQGCAETILIRDGIVIEGAASNVFVVTGKLIKTPNKGHQMLTGITRDLVLEIAASQNIETVECDIAVDELLGADEVWISSSTKEVLPVTSIDGKQIGDGTPGPVWQELISYYADYKKRLVAGEIS
ncbi:MAG: D-amino acid aminotransferase [Gammaproteobacteria bacterium]|nr:D-amino acid aminotransferase [Gammaproteobacteria bacterium]